MRNSSNISPSPFVVSFLACVLVGVPAAAETTPRNAQGSSSSAQGSESSSSASPTSPAAAIEDSDHALQLRDLEEKANDLKERIFRSKARLILLRETVMNGSIAGAKARLVHRNEMGSAFSLQEISYSLDGAPLLAKQDASGALDDSEEIELFNGSIVPGNHNLAVYLVYQGNGYGIFSYLKGYTFKIKSSYAFTAEEGKLTTVKAVAYEKGGMTTGLKDRPAMRYDVDTTQEANGVDGAVTTAEGAKQTKE